MLTEATLKEIPGQFLSYCRMKGFVPSGVQ